jgi:4-diphosphocytidyl-2-C-methyl-D-erythritol kinase
VTDPDSIQFLAPAKLNLFLHITGRREDGYHLLQTVFQLLDYGDVLGYRVSDAPEIVCEYQLVGVAQEQDLILRAAQLLQGHCGIDRGVRIQLEKRLPMGGGLGGGSSDAATTLLALNYLWDCGLTTAQLAALGLHLGADVPVFVHGHSAWAEGVGQELQAVTLPESWYLVLNPQVNVSTAEVFADAQLIRDCPPITIRDFLAGQGRNVCQPIVTARHPQVMAAIEALSEYAPAMMTGTGACVFARFDTQTAADAAWQVLSGSWDGFVAKGIAISPVYTRLQALAEKD